MNKKVSTIFSMVALMGGSLLSSAYAQSETAALNGSLLDKYESGSVMLGHLNSEFFGLKDGDNDTKSTEMYAESNDQVEKKLILNYTWNVKIDPANDTRDYPHYMFVNSITGDTLSFEKITGNLLIQDKQSTPKKKWAKDGLYTFVFEDASNKTKAYGKDMKLKTAADKALDTDGDGEADAAGYVNISSTKTSLINTGAKKLFLYNLATASAEIAELNALYNGKGFNLGAKPDLTSTDVVDGNLFDSDSQRIWAYEVNAGDETSTTNGKGYELPDNNGDGTKLYVPRGVYFFTNPVFKNGKGAADYVIGDLKAKDIDWLNSSFIALSPTETLEATDVARGQGEGFKLIVEKGTNFIFKGNTSDYAGEDLPIQNACFTVNTNFSADYPYAISLNEFYYQKTANYKGTDKQDKVAAYLGVSSYNNTEQSLVSMKGAASDAEYLFFLKASSVLDGKKLLHTSKKAAVYAIKFVSGQSSDKDLINKYLTVGTDGSSFQWEAKGAAIADTDFPIFQFVITAVDDENNVTFTNRETGKSFKTQLFPEEGTNRYSLSTTGITDIVPFTVKTTSANTYEVDDLLPVSFDSDIVVELTRLDNVDQFAGFLNTEDKAIRTLAFARDKNDTSNKFYSVVEDYLSAGSLTKRLAKDEMLRDVFVNDISDAAQWQLIKGSAATISRVYVYNNTATESVDDVPNGDKVSVYTYSLRYVTDGTETDWFLKNKYTSSSSYDLKEVVGVKKASDLASHTDVKFFIKENVDGSVSLMPYSRFTASSNKIANYNEEKTLEVELNTTTGVRSYDFNEDVYQSTSEATDIKTYLDPKPIEISWPAKEGHITLESELGNYITMNENRDAIVVNETEADKFYLYVTDKDAIVPSFYLTKGVGAKNGERMFLFNPTDSVNYYVATGDYDREYQWAENKTKVLFKAASINETRDTLTINVKGEVKKVAKEADDNNKNIWGGLNRFKFQIIEAADEDGYYRIRQTNSDNYYGNYLSSLNDKMTWSGKSEALLFKVEETSAPTSNENVSATEVKVVAQDGAVVVKNAAGKNVVVSTILGQVVANEVLTSDNATINVPAGIVVVAVDGESFKVNVK
ncbi:MAG: DUF6383 domain-containing protein [Parabacteroides sp.]|nr:DUF6383 domain-containing protein [Parabacteroides sp.]